MLRDDWLGTWGPRLRLLPMLQHANVLRYFPSEWHQRGGMNQKSLSYSAAFLIMEWCEMGRLPESVHTLVAFVAIIVDFFPLQRQGYSPERSHRRVHREALVLAGVSTYSPTCWRARRRLGGAEAMLRQVASGLSFLHRHGILHGEVKVLLTLKTRERKKAEASYLP